MVHISSGSTAVTDVKMVKKQSVEFPALVSSRGLEIILMTLSLDCSKSNIFLAALSASLIISLVIQ